MRSIPIPKAYPEYISLSILQFLSTLGSTIPHPSISTQPVCLQNGHPLPPHILHEISISALGSVNGKYEGLRRIFVSSPNISLAKKRSACFRSAKETSLSIYNASTW